MTPYPWKSKGICNEDGSVTTVAALVETYNSFFGGEK